MNHQLAERYSLVRRIGRGGYGDVWLARDEQRQRDVAIKLLNIADGSRRASKKKTERFRREALSMARIRHDNVVAIYDVGATPEKQELFIVMELLRGRNLFEEIELHGPLSPERCLQRFAEALGGLEAAHQLGIIHKDLKPANLLLHNVDQPDEQMKLIDFGIARMDSLTKLTSTGRMAGSPRYLAPEYIMGESIAPSVDVYQMALIMVEALTGEACIPRHLEFFQVCQRHILSQLEIPPALEDSSIGPILRRALQRQPADRFASAREFAEALATVLPHELPRFQVYDEDETLISAPPDFDPTIPEDESSVTAMVEKLREHESETNRYAAVFSMDEVAARSAEVRAAEPAAAATDAPRKAPVAPSRPMVWLVWIAATALVASIAAAAMIHWNRRVAQASTPPVETTSAPNDAAAAPKN